MPDAFPSPIPTAITIPGRWSDTTEALAPRWHASAAQARNGATSPIAPRRVSGMGEATDPATSTTT